MQLRLFTISILFFLVGKAFSQSYKYVYYFDDNFNTTEQSKATVIGKGYVDNSAFKLDFYNKANNKLLLSATYTDSTLGVLNGMFRTYYNDMKPESLGNYVDNEMDGVWRHWNMQGFVTDSLIYSNGIITSFAKLEYHYNKIFLRQYPPTDSLRKIGYWVNYSFTDSLNNTFYEKKYTVLDKVEKIDYEVSFEGKRGLYIEYDSTGAIKEKDSVFSRANKEAALAGGDYAWRLFLQQNLNPLVAVDNRAPAGTYTLIVKFLVNTDGTLDDVKVEDDPGYGMGKEAIRVIKKSGKWTPAIRYGRYIKAYRRQPIAFSIDSN